MTPSSTPRGHEACLGVKSVIRRRPAGTAPWEAQVVLRDDVAVDLDGPAIGGRPLRVAVGVLDRTVADGTIAVPVDQRFWTNEIYEVGGPHDEVLRREHPAHRPGRESANLYVERDGRQPL